MLCQRRRRWPRVDPTSGQRLVFAVSKQVNTAETNDIACGTHVWSITFPSRLKLKKENEYFSRLTIMRNTWQ